MISRAQTLRRSSSDVRLCFGTFNVELSKMRIPSPCIARFGERYLLESAMGKDTLARVE